MCPRLDTVEGTAVSSAGSVLTGRISRSTLVFAQEVSYQSGVRGTTTVAQKKKRRGRSLASFFGTGSKPADTSGGTPVAAHAFSGRFLIAMVVLFVIILTTYASVSTFFRQQAEINQVKDHISQLQAENSDLKTQLSWWKDDNYVKQQAKSRLYYVSEGETPYLVVGTDFTSSLADGTSAQAQTAPEDSWANGLWNSFQSAALDGEKSKNTTVDPSSSTTTAPDQPSASASASADSTTSTSTPAATTSASTP